MVLVWSLLGKNASLFSRKFWWKFSIDSHKLNLTFFKIVVRLIKLQVKVKTWSMQIEHIKKSSIFMNFTPEIYSFILNNYCDVLFYFNILTCRLWIKTHKLYFKFYVLKLIQSCVELHLFNCFLLLSFQPANVHVFSQGEFIEY